MGDKKDFLSELSKDLDAKKHGVKSHIDSVDDFVPASKPKTSTPIEDDLNEIPDVPEETPTPIQTAPRQTAPKQTFFQEPEDETEEEYGEDGNPDSFEEEERVKIEKPKVQIKKGWIIGGIVALALIGVAIWWFAFAPHITMPDFAGKKMDEVAVWAKQNKIENTYISQLEDYSLEIPSGSVISQSVVAGKQITNQTNIVFTVSKGANPEDPVDFPDIKNMTQDEISAWISENQLSKAKITTQYSTTVESGGVISYDLKSVSENNFTRGTSLSIVCSKGPAPVGQVTVENYVGKTYSELSAWATTKKIVLNKQESYSDTVESGFVISQSPASGSAMNEGDTLTVVVSKGKGVTIPNLVGFTAEQLTAWQSNKDNTVVVVTSGVYSMQKLGSVVGQDIAPGTRVDSGTVLMLKTSLYMPILETNSQQWLGKDFLELNAWCDEVNDKGANILAIKQGEEYSDQYPTPGQIIYYECEGSLSSSTQAEACGRPLGTNARIGYVVSLGPLTPPTTASPAPSEPTPQYFFSSAEAASLTAINNFCNTNGMNCTYQQVDTLSTRGQVIVTVNGQTYDSNPTPPATPNPATMMLPAGTTIDIKYKP